MFVANHPRLFMSLLAIMSLTPAAALAQPFTYTYFPSNTVVNTPVTTDYAIIGYSGGTYNPDFTRNFTGPSSPTVGIAAGADIPDAEIFNSSVVNITGGTAAVFPYDHSTVNIYGGSVPFALGQEFSVINVHAGAVADLEGQGQRINVFGGTIDTLVANVQTDYLGNTLGVCTVDVTGGTITTEINAFNGGILDLRGGQILAPFVRAVDGSTINIYGSGLTSQLIDPNVNTYSIYSVSGLLADGTSINGLQLRIKNDGASSFTLNNVPTPGAAGVLALGGLIGARRRR